MLAKENRKFRRRYPAVSARHDTSLNAELARLAEHYEQDFNRLQCALSFLGELLTLKHLKAEKPIGDLRPCSRFAHLLFT